LLLGFTHVPVEVYNPFSRARRAVENKRLLQSQIAKPLVTCIIFRGPAYPVLMPHMRDDQHWRTAIHEAAHCVAAHELGVPVYGAQIGRRRGLATIAGMRGIDANWHRCGDYRAGDPHFIVNTELQICLAGPAGQKIHGDSSAWGCEGDQRMIDELRRRYDISDVRIESLERRTRKLLLRRWGDVIRLASRLLDAGSLERDEIEAILNPT
jgi:hypothetical protein